MIVEQGQCLVDMAIQYNGNALAIFDIALINGISLTEDIVPGQELKETAVLDNRIKNYFSKITPARGSDIDTLEQQGIGYWYIGLDFIIS
ncbi:MAG: hypothetical protein LC096_06680 [Bacteroidia bacterium]|nr:hypothetical protein [Bacteroidia bacterium]